MIRKILSGIVFGGIAIASLIMFFINGNLSDLQKETALILLIIMGSAVLYCFLVGEISRNNSQMDKLWSLLPIAYIWVVAAKGNFHPRLVIMAILVTLWGIRLTINFARKGAYRLKFWTGEEDYRWEVLRKTKYFQSKIAWGAFDLFFISFYQNAIVLLICFPAVAALGHPEALGWLDYVGAGLAAAFLMYELAADEQQYIFQTTKWKMIKEGKKLEELPDPFNKGFNTFGLWNYSRHPNYLGEQGFWVAICIFSVAAGAGYFNWSFFGAALLVLLFIGSSTFGEAISAKKYPEYKEYIKKVFCYLPVRKYRK